MSEPWAAWTPQEDSEERAAPGGFASFIAGMRPDPAEGVTIEQVFARSRQAGDPAAPRSGSAWTGRTARTSGRRRCWPAGMRPGRAWTWR
jgi:hypothetical protein